MRITVITVCRNALDALKRTTESVLAQDYPALEYIIVDGASTDGTVPFLQMSINGREAEHSERTRWLSEPDLGIYDAMNKGARMATGRYCLFMNAGDTFVSPTTVSQMAERMQDDGCQADVYYGDVVKNGVVKPSGQPRNHHRMFYCHQSVFTSTACLRQFPFDLRHRMSADFKQAKQLLLAGKRFVYIPLPVADFDTSGVSNVLRSRGLRDNISVVWEVDAWPARLRFLPHLLFPYLLCRLRGK